MKRAVEELGFEAVIADTAQQVREAWVLILPGVGALADGMQGLRERDMLQPIWGCAESGVPILGICLGMQMLFDSSREYGLHRGLGLIPGHVERIPGRSSNGSQLAVPHIGWAALEPAQATQQAFSPSILQHVQPGEEVYFVHSFAAKPRNRQDISAVCQYGGHKLCAAVEKENIYGAQFHPEKSGAVGLRILSAFLQQATAKQAGMQILV